MSKIDTSAEAVERVVKWATDAANASASRAANLRSHGWGDNAGPWAADAQNYQHVYALIGALAAERDSLKRVLPEVDAAFAKASAERDAANACAAESAEIMRRQRDRLEAERDAERAKVSRLREAGRVLHNAAASAVVALRPENPKRGNLAIACHSWVEAARIADTAP